jgi:hypothetical protein
VGQGDVPPPPRALGRDPGLTSSDGGTGANRTLRSPRGPLPRCRPHAPAELVLRTAPVALASLRGRPARAHRAEAADPSTGRGHNNASRTRLRPRRDTSRRRILLPDIHGARGRTDTRSCAAPRGLSPRSSSSHAPARDRRHRPRWNRRGAALHVRSSGRLKRLHAQGEGGPSEGARHSRGPGRGRVGTPSERSGSCTHE